MATSCNSSSALRKASPSGFSRGWPGQGTLTSPGKSRSYQTPKKLPTLHICALATLCNSSEDPGVVVALFHSQAAPVPLLLPHLLQLHKISEEKPRLLYSQLTPLLWRAWVLLQTGQMAKTSEGSELHILKVRAVASPRKSWTKYWKNYAPQSGPTNLSRFSEGCLSIGRAIQVGEVARQEDDFTWTPSFDCFPWWKVFRGWNSWRRFYLLF